MANFWTFNKLKTKERLSENISENPSLQLEKALQEMLPAEEFLKLWGQKAFVISNFLSFNPWTTRITSVGPWLVLEWKEKTVSIHLVRFSAGWNEAIQEISYDETQKKYIEEITAYKEQVLSITQIWDAIKTALQKNTEEAWEVIDENDIITRWVLKWKTLVEAIFIMRKKIIHAQSSELSLWNIDTNIFPWVEVISQDLIQAEEQYLLLSLWIWENNEELVHVIPKTQSESKVLIKNAIARRNSQEILDWMKELHAEVDANNWQDGTVEKNYKYFFDTLNTLALLSIVSQVRDNESSQYYHDTGILLEFATLVSGRADWNRESHILMNDIWKNASPVDSRLWDPDIARQGLSYAMDISHSDTGLSVHDLISPHLEIQDPLIGNKNPTEIVLETKRFIQESVKTEKWESLNEQALQDVFEAFGYTEIVLKAETWDIGNSYQELSLKEMIALSWLIRIRKQLEIVEYTRGSWHTWRKRTAHYAGKIKTTSFGEFVSLASNAGKEAIQHMGRQLDKNFDDSWEEALHTEWSEANKIRAQKFGITDTNSVAYKIFSLYNDINGNGGFWEVSDTTKVTAKTWGYMAAMVIGWVMLWGWAVAALWARGITIGLTWEGALMWASWSGLWYALDASIWDARGFYTPDEFVLWVGWDFLLWAWTGAIGGPLVQKFWNPNATFFARESLKNKWIFAWDLTVLGLYPEMKRIELMDRKWHGSEIFTSIWNSDSPAQKRIQELRTWYLAHAWSTKEIQTYLQAPQAENISPSLRKYRFFLQEFWNMWFTLDDIPQDFDIRFQEAYAIWSFLSPWDNKNIWQNEAEFQWVMKIWNWWIQKSRENILQATEKWIQRQGKRLSAIT